MQQFVSWATTTHVKQFLIAEAHLPSKSPHHTVQLTAPPCGQWKKLYSPPIIRQHVLQYFRDMLRQATLLSNLPCAFL